jgi:hypothetical protein
MTIKFFHVRVVDDEGRIQPTGGCTVAYIADRANKIVTAAYTKCRDDELFCYAKGREEAERKLKNPEGEFDVLELYDPISEMLAEWIGQVVWPDGPPSWGMGFAIDVDSHRTKKGTRWVSTFWPSQWQTEVQMDLKDEFTKGQDQLALT